MSAAPHDGVKDKKESAEPTNINSTELDLSRENTVRILVDFGSVKNGTGAPEASLQLMKGIRERYGFKGTFELVPLMPEATYNNNEKSVSEQGKAELDTLTEKAEARVKDFIAKNEKVRRVDVKDIGGPNNQKCKFGFTGAYDRRTGGDSETNRLYDNGVGCECFITLSTQGWLTYQDDNDAHERMGPNIRANGSPRIDISVHLPRKDVLALSELEIAQCQKVKNDSKELQVTLYKLDQKKNELLLQRPCILESLKKYAIDKGKTIKVVEITDESLDEKGIAEKSRLLSEQYKPLTITVLKPNLSSEAYHKLLASSHGVFCEGQSTGSQSMLYGAASFHIPLDGQGVNIHQSNLKINKKEGFVLDDAQEKYTKEMNKNCDIMRKGKDSLYPDQKGWKAAANKKVTEKYYNMIEVGLESGGQACALSIAKGIRDNKKLDMLTQCIISRPKAVATQNVSASAGSLPPPPPSVLKHETPSVPPAAVIAQRKSEEISKAEIQRKIEEGHKAEEAHKLEKQTKVEELRGAEEAHKAEAQIKRAESYKAGNAARPPKPIPRRKAIEARKPGPVSKLPVQMGLSKKDGVITLTEGAIGRTVGGAKSGKLQVGLAFELFKKKYSEENTGPAPAAQPPLQINPSDPDENRPSL
jgi:hypothetical protein